MEKLIEKLNLIEKNIEHKDKFNEKISKSNVAWHLDHIVKAHNAIIYVVKNSNPSSYKNSFNIKRFIVLSLGFIPRGKAKAPKEVQSFDEITAESIQKQLAISIKLVNDLESIPSNHHFKHPYLGIMNVKQTFRFLEIHANHHLKIIDDIVSK